MSRARPAACLPVSGGRAALVELGGAQPPPSRGALGHGVGGMGPSLSRGARCFGGVSPFGRVDAYGLRATCVGRL
eukprot:13038843-Alexandrium_andersonii.AAC.1